MRFSFFDEGRPSSLLKSALFRPFVCIHKNAGCGVR